MGQVTSTDRRTALRTGAGLLAAGAFTAGCAPNGAVARSTSVAHASARSSAHADADPPTASPAPSPRGYPGRPAQLTHGPRTRPRVALTFHGQGDPAIARALLTTAEKHGAHLTVLAVGSWLDAQPELARRILDGGHDLGNHTQRHLAVNTMSEADARTEITACAGRLKKLTGSIGTWFRPSRAPLASPLVVRLAREAGYPHVLSYDVDSLDYTRPGADAVARKVLGEVRGGSVVSLHFGYPDTVAALPVVLEELARRGLSAVSTTELFS
ncbi:polysaccharide deacetylase family protein [Streptomyces sp. NPDC050534]|uniref:polysaccharide deacetylase family protein n=1 Tax=Streptomyces sp. NPDC050534 TaxID=3365625 RepID=UPI00379C708F